MSGETDLFRDLFDLVQQEESKESSRLRLSPLRVFRRQFSSTEAEIVHQCQQILNVRSIE